MQVANGTQAARVLVVDDEAELCSLLREVFGHRMQIDTATSAEEAIEHLVHHDYEAVVSDVCMPGGMGGLELCRWIGSHRPDLQGKLILMSGYGDEYADYARQAGAVFVAKPYPVSILRRAIMEAIEVGTPVRA